MKTKTWIKVLYCVGIFGLIAASFFAARYFFSAQTAQASELPSAAISPDSPTTSFNCSKIVTIASLDNRIHIRCQDINGGVLFYAAANTDPNANRYLAIGNTIYALAKAAWIFYDPDQTHNPPGCAATNCRLLLGIEGQ